MGTAQYDVISKGDGWAILHDGAVGMAYSTKEPHSKRRCLLLP